MSDGRLIRFPGTSPSAPIDDELLIRRIRERTFCQHPRTRIDAVARRLYCSDCEREIDPLDWLEGLAKRWESVVAVTRGLEQRRRMVEAQLEDLLRQEQNARARLRRLEATRA